MTTLHVFELDRFFVPKELVLHLTALIAGAIAARASRDRVDVFLGLYLAASVVSALFATNPWLAMRAVAISASSILLFWSGRALRDAGYALPLIRGLALAVIAAAGTSLLQTYGIDLDVFSEQRAPGGTLGNRNFVAHVAAFGFPLLLYVVMKAERWLVWAGGAALVVASLVLTRSRAAWLAFAAVMIVFIVTSLFYGLRPLAAAFESGDESPQSKAVWRRLAGMAGLSAIAVAAALLLPNALQWRSDNPYLDTMKRVADYGGGSGRGRLVQYRRSLLMAARHPLLGVGPGNWAVEYPAFAVRDDPSMNDSTPGMTYNPWPSSDWIAAVSERGFAATILLGLVFLTLALRARDPFTWSLIAGVLVAGLFDAVLLLAVPAILFWPAVAAFGVRQHAAALESGGMPPHSIRLVAVLVLLLSLMGSVRSASQLIAMQIYTIRSDRASLSRAARIDPGNFRLQRRIGHRKAAQALYPHARIR